MPNVVEIKIVVDNAQAVQGVQQTISQFDQLVPAIDRNTHALDALTEKLGKGGQSMRTMSGHTSTTLDGVRLLSQEFGLRLPRALESMIARMPGVTGALNGLIGVFAGIAAVEVGVHLASELGEAYTKYVSLNSEADKFYETLKKTSQEDFGNSRSIETTRARLGQATTDAAGKQQEAQAARDRAMYDINPYRTGQDLGAAFELKKQAAAASASMVKLTNLDTDQEHQRNIQRIEDSHNVTAAMSAERQVAVERDKAYRLADENRGYDRKKDMELGNFVAPNAGAAAQQEAYLKADNEANAKLIANRKEVTEKTITLRNEAVNAGLRGNALYAAQEAEAEATIRRNVNGTQAEIAAVRLKYHNEEMKRIEEETDALAKREEVEKLAGLTGLAKIQEQGDDRLREIDRRQSRGGYASPADADHDRALSQAQTLRERKDLDKQYQEQEAAENNRADADKISGFARVDHELQSSLDRRAKAFADMYGQLDHQDAAYLAGQQRLADDVAHDSENADRQRAELTQQINDRTTAMDRQAAEAERRVRGDGLTAWVRNYQDAVVEIQAAHAELIAKIDAEQRKTGGDPGQYERQKVDADRVANAQIAEQNEEMKHRIAGTLQDAFTDPLRFIEDKFKEMLFNMVADAIVHSNLIKGAFGGILGGASTGAAAGTSAGQVPGVAAAAGTVAQMSAVPGFSGTVTGSGGGTLAAGSTTTGSTTTGSTTMGSTTGSGIAGVSDLGSLAQTGASAVDSLRSTGAGADAGIDDGGGYSYNGDDGGFGGSWINGSNAGSVAGAGGAASGASSGLSALGSVVGAGFGAYTGTTGVISAYESGKASGILSGAVSGATLGASVGMLGGPLGSAIGAGIGAIGGSAAGLVGWATGEGGRIAGAKYFKETIRPAMDDAETAYLHGGGDIYAALSQVNQAAVQGYDYLYKQYGIGTADWVNDAYIKKETSRLTTDMTKLAGAGRDYMAQSAVQFHTGGLVRGFGTLGTGGDEGFIHAQLGEVVTSRADSLEHAPMLQAIGNGASPSDMARMYLQAAGSFSGGGSPSGSGGDTHHHWTVNAMDSKSFEHFLTHGGGMDKIAYAANKRTNGYAGDSF